MADQPKRVLLADRCLDSANEQQSGEHLDGALGHMAQEGEVAQNVKGHGRAPDGAFARQAPLPVVDGAAQQQGRRLSARSSCSSSSLHHHCGYY